MIYYDKELIGRPFYNTMRHLLVDNNLGLVVPRQNKEHGGGFITNRIIGQKLFSAYDINYVFPEKAQIRFENKRIDRTPNFKITILNKIAAKLGLQFINEKEPTSGTFAPIDILDYIYAVLHSPTYREKYKEFLKIDFPRVPYPKDANTFWQLVKLGGELRQVHLLESPKVNQFITTYPITGNNLITKPRFELTQTHQLASSSTCQLGTVWINDQQYFDGVPLTAWNFYIGGYQPAQKWLKDRKGRVLNFEDILHYQKIIVALTETARIMGEINGIEVE
jgi:predicted helicase